MTYTERDLISFAAYRMRFSDDKSESYKNMMDCLYDWKEERAKHGPSSVKRTPYTLNLEWERKAAQGTPVKWYRKLWERFHTPMHHTYYKRGM
jgi:hypothetical protein